MQPNYIATDSEVFITDNDNVITGIGLIGGSKRHPYLVEGGNLQEDNVLGEFAIDKVKVDDNGEDLFVSRIQQVMESLKQRIAPLDYSIIPSHVLDKGVLIDAGREAFRFSCDRDFNAYSRRANPRINYNGGLRTAGGHIHLSWDDVPFTIEQYVKACDLFLGIPSLLMDMDRRRKTLYGKAGCFRPKTYPDGSKGVEYRTLSNFWIKSEAHMRWAYKNTLRAFNEAVNIDNYLEDIECNLESVINVHSLSYAENLVDKYNLDVVE